MWDPEQNCPHTAHTLNLVEVFVVGEGFAAGKTALRSGDLAEYQKQVGIAKTAVEAALKALGR